MNILDEDMQMVRDWLAAAGAPFHIQSHFDNLVDEHAKEAARVEELQDEVNDLESEAKDAKELEEEIETLRAEIDQRDSDQDRVLADVKYWLIDLLVHKTPMRIMPRVMLRKIEDVL